MLKSKICLITLLLPVMTIAVSAQDLTSDKQKFSYAVGVQIGQNLKAQSLDVDSKALIQGMTDTISKAPLKLTIPEMEQAVKTYQEQEQKRLADVGEKNKVAGEAFLVENKKNKDIIELASGLQYKVLTKGTGAQPKVTDAVVVHYRGTLIDGTEFDSSYSRGQPVTIMLNQVIPGWQEALPLMPVGSKWQIFLPSKLGYGEGSAGPIGPNSALIFDIELVSIGAPAAQTPAMTPAP